MNATVTNDVLGQPLLFLVCVSDFLKLRTSLRVTAALLGIRILALFVFSARRLGRRQGFLRTVPRQLFSS